MLSGSNLFNESKILPFILKSSSQNLKEERRGTQSKLSVKLASDALGAVSSAAVGPPAGSIGSKFSPDISEHFLLPSARKLYGDADFILLGTCPHCYKNHFCLMIMALLCLVDRQIARPKARRESIG